MLVIDSGFGGLTVLEEIKGSRKNLDMPECYYIADSMHAPYGDKSCPYIVERIRNIINHAIHNLNIKVVIIACHTASSVIGHEFHDLYNEMYTIITMLEPTLDALPSIPDYSKVLLLCTKRTAESGIIEYSIKNANPTLDLTVIPCQNFAWMIEKYGIDDVRTIQEVESVCSTFSHYDAVIYGCTHYPLLHTIIKQFFNQNTIFINPAKQVINQINFALLNNSNKIHYYTTGDPFDVNNRTSGFKKMLPYLNIINFRKISI